MISYKDIALQILSYSSQADYNCYRVKANFVLNFVGMATEVGRGKMQLAAFDGSFPLKTPYRHKNITKIPLATQVNFAKISYASRVIANFVLNFVAMATRFAQGKIRLASFDGPSPKTHYGRKNLADISYTNRVIVNFVPKFVAMATRVTRREI